MFRFILFALFCCVWPWTSATAQSFGDLPADQRANAVRAVADLQQPVSPTNWKAGTIGKGAEAGIVSPKNIKPFGAELFSGGFRGTRADGLNPDYKILPGDQITLRVWGAVEIDRILPVDAQGNIFIPTIGPVMVMGVSHQQLEHIVRAAVTAVYPGSVQVYTNLQGVQPVAVYVAGFVAKPGRYAGIPSDSVLYFLDQAGGVDEQLGSYRQIKLMRRQQQIAVMDLYDFILKGQLLHGQLQDGDTIMVERRGPVVTVSGNVGRAYQYELTNTALYGKTLMELAQLKATASHALLRGSRQSKPVAEYLSLDTLATTQVSNGDDIQFVADQRADMLVIQLEGSYQGRSHFVVPKNTTLKELLNNVAVDPQSSDYANVSLRRISVAERQRQSLEDSLRRLETTYLGAPSSTADESAIRVREAELISQFVARVREIKPNGRMVLSENGELQDLRLQDGDIITLPPRTDAILVSGEVYIPQSSIFIRGKTALDYIESAGGFSQHADDDNILVLRPNGEVRKADDIELQPGDEILVLPAVTTKNLQLATALTQILYQVAIAAKVAVDL